MQQAESRDVVRQIAARGRQSVVLNPIADSVVSHAVNVSGKHSFHVAGIDQSAMNPFPVATGIARSNPARMMHEDEDVIQFFQAVKRLLQEFQLPGTHVLHPSLAETFLAGNRVAFVCIQHDKSTSAMLKRIPQRAEVFFIVGFVFARRFVAILAIPVHVVVAGHRKPRTGQPIHDRPELPHFRQPFLCGVVAVDEIPHGHDEIGIEQIRILHGLIKDPQPGRCASGAVAEHDKLKHIRIDVRKSQHMRRSARREHVRIVRHQGRSTNNNNGGESN